MKRSGKVAKWSFAVLATLWAAWVMPERVFVLAKMPSGVGAWFVSYADNRTYGFGPGGNETGFNVILLTRSGAARVAQGGAGYLNRENADATRGKWTETPVERNESWLGREGGAAEVHDNPTVDAVLWHYGFGFDIPADHKAAVDAALNVHGSFVRGTVLIVPATQRPYFFYAG